MINNKLLKEIEEYCKYNNIDNIELEINRILRIGFNIIRFGVSPFKPYEEESKEKIEEEKPIKKKVGRPKKEKNYEVDISKIEVKQENVIVEEPIVNEVKKKVRIIKNK